MNWLADAIEAKFYRDGRRQDLLDQLKKLNPNKNYEFYGLSALEEAVDELDLKF
jgi:hypothetical protein